MPAVIPSAVGSSKTVESTQFFNAGQKRFLQQATIGSTLAHRPPPQQQQQPPHKLPRVDAGGSGGFPRGPHASPLCAQPSASSSAVQDGDMDFLASVAARSNAADHAAGSMAVT
eukprot:CAMPEP_0196730370 /NCGR_PEP_ID=MMETSP1091-20130531/10438_1 /TAXON_ID=302021 /ORGANISM="Rhodomonas sp., Strain CCMP768" /LENGTH=113 /DNA_ID=CAMNT_0042073353 /DNA_START=397 /DNA_END=735 /DNA_ORIENTATION=-